MYNLILNQEDIGILTFYYDDENNRFINENGYVVFRIHEFVPPNAIFLFKTYKANMIWTNTELGIQIELIWPLSEYENMLLAEHEYRSIY